MLGKQKENEMQSQRPLNKWSAWTSGNAEKRMQEGPCGK